MPANSRWDLIQAFKGECNAVSITFLLSTCKEWAINISLGSQINSTSNKHNARYTWTLYWVLYVKLADGIWMLINVKIHLSCSAYIVYTGKLDSRTRENLASGNVQIVYMTSSCPAMRTFKFSYAFCLLPAWFRDQIAYVNNSESHKQIADLCEPGRVASPADSHVFQGWQVQMLGACRKSPGINP